MSNSWRPYGLQSTRPLRPWDFSGKSTGVGCHHEYSGLISFRIDWFDLFAVQGTLKSLLQHHNEKSSILWCSAFFMVQLSHCRSVSISRSVVSDSLLSHGLWPTMLLCPWNSPGKNTGVGCHFLLQGIFPTQGLNLIFLHCRQILYLVTTGKTIALTIWTFVIIIIR